MRLHSITGKIGKERGYLSMLSFHRRVHRLYFDNLPFVILTCLFVTLCVVDVSLLPFHLYHKSFFQLSLLNHSLVALHVGILIFFLFFWTFNAFFFFEYIYLINTYMGSICYHEYIDWHFKSGQKMAWAVEISIHFCLKYKKSFIEY